MRKSVVFLVGVAMSSAVCCAVSDRSDLHGAYVARYRAATERLSLNADGTFVQEVELGGTQKTLVARGSWSYGRDSGYVTFDESFLHVVDGFGNFDPDYVHRARGITAYPAAKSCRGLSIGSDEGVLYRKVR